MGELFGQTAVIVGGGRARAVVADASDEIAAKGIIAGALDWQGGIDLLLVCAGAALIKPLPEVTLAEWDRQSVRV